MESGSERQGSTMIRGLMMSNLYTCGIFLENIFYDQLYYLRRSRGHIKIVIYSILFGINE